MSTTNSIASVLAPELVWMLLIALAISASGFIRLVYFVSVGYAFSITGMAAAAYLAFMDRFVPLPALHLALLALYGLRLGIYLVSREKSPSYRQELQEIQGRNTGVGLVKRLLIWMGVSILYVFMFVPAFYRGLAVRAQQDDPAVLLTLAGVLVMAAGLGLETLADLQKSKFKKKYPKHFCNTGVYRWVRCPNYLGEVIFWTGSIIAGASALNHWLSWAAALLGYICIVLIMMGSTKRLEYKQDERYGKNGEYREYVKTVPVLFPFIPVYSLKGVKVYLE